MLKYGML